MAINIEFLIREQEAIKKENPPQGDLLMPAQAPGAKRPKNQSKMTVIYLVGSNTIAALKAAGLKDDEAKPLVKNIIYRWAKSGNRPKIADLNIDDENIEKALKSASLAEAFAYQKNKIAIVDVNPKFFAKIIRECS
jgi:hypothetical protein